MPSRPRRTGTSARASFWISCVAVSPKQRLESSSDRYRLGPLRRALRLRRQQRAARTRPPKDSRGQLTAANLVFDAPQLPIDVLLIPSPRLFTFCCCRTKETGLSNGGALVWDRLLCAIYQFRVRRGPPWTSWQRWPRRAVPASEFCTSARSREWPVSSRSSRRSRRRIWCATRFNRWGVGRRGRRSLLFGAQEHVARRIGTKRRAGSVRRSSSGPAGFAESQGFRVVE